MTIARTSHIGTLLLIIATAAVLVIAVMIFGAHLRLWEPIVGFGYIRNYLNPIGTSLFILSAIGFIYQIMTSNRTGAIKSVIAMLIGAALIMPMVSSFIQPAKRAPAIHDITTDMTNPPEFLALDDKRSGARNSLIYAGEDVALIQKKMYPNIKPIQSNLSAPNAFAKTLIIAQEMGWEIISKDSEILRFEATAQTIFFGFLDDVVVKVTPANGGSRIDIRSVSRVGRSDKGVNTARIVEFTENFNH